MMKKRIISILLSCCMMLTLLPTAVFAEGGGAEATQCVCETACTAEQMNTECPVCGAADAAPENCGKYRGDSTDPQDGNDDSEDGDTDLVDGVEGSEDPPEQSAAEKVQALIDALPDADSISAENAEGVAAQLAAIDTAKAALSDEEQAALDMTRYEAASTALAALERASMTIHVMLPDATVLTLEDVKAEDTIGSIKTKIQSEKGYAVTLQKLFATLGEVKTELQDENTLSVYAIQSGATLTLELLAEKPDGTYDLAEGSIEVTVDETGAQTVKQGEHITPHTGAVTIMQSGSDTPTTQYGITVTAAAGQTANIILSGVNIDLSATGSTSEKCVGTAAMVTYGDGNVTLELDGVNHLISGVCRAGLEKHNAGMLTINDSNAVPGSLRAVGFVQSAGIGGNTGYRFGFEDERVTLANANAENITINGGTIEAIGYPDSMDTDGTYFLGAGAGIGGGHGGYAKNITINGGNITARSGAGAGIGSGAGVRIYTEYFYGEADNIVITGGEITATAISGGAGIGGGFQCTGKNITITGGKVIASGGTYRKSNSQTNGGGAGIGGGGYRDGKNITINGGKVTATGGACKNSGGGAGIGGGGGSNDTGSCSGSDITITGGEVIATGGAGNENKYSREYTGGAGIGGGGFKSNSDKNTAGTGTNISLSHATVTAVGAVGGAGIGGGGCSSERAPAGGSAGKDITIESCTVNASSARNGAGIGGGYGGSGEIIRIRNCKEVTATGRDGAGIGGGYNGSGKVITIEDSKILADGSGAAGIGGGGSSGSGYACHGENITIKNSNVTAKGYTGAAIGGGEYGDGRNILIQNSEVTATYLDDYGYGAGIGGGKNGNGEDITITDSKVTANTYRTSGGYGAGIGGGCVDLNLDYDDCGKAYGIGRRITIQNSEVIATASSGAGIGGGCVKSNRNKTITPDASLGWGNGEKITIINSTVTATSNEGAGIGGGDYSGSKSLSRYDSIGRNITIESGTVTARSNNGGAGIGGGCHGDAENITINGGVVTATAHDGEEFIRGGAGIGGGFSGNAKGITVNGGTVIATGGGHRRNNGNGYVFYVGGAGIGGGGRFENGGGDAEDITVNGGTVIATGGPNAAGIGGGATSATTDYYINRDYPLFTEDEESWLPMARSGCAKNITINGGTVTAIGQDKASGIGGGGFHTKYDEDKEFGENTSYDYAHLNPQRAAGCAENITINGGFITVQGGQYGSDIGRSEFNFKGRVSTESGLTVTGGTFYRSIPANVEVQGHVVQYQVGETVSAWQVVRHGELAYLPCLTDESGVSLEAWYRENEAYDFAAPVTAGMTLTAQAHTYGDWTVTKEPTAVRVGEKQRTCTDCGHVQTTEIPAPVTPGHVCVYDRETVMDDALKTAADCTHDAVYYKRCACGILSSTVTFTAEGTKLGHEWMADWCHDAKQHWHECTRCHTQNDRRDHSLATASTGSWHCTSCNYDVQSSHTHTPGISIAAKAATCTEAGNKAYHTCSGCDGWFEDEACTMQISKKLDVFLAPFGHKPAVRWQTDEATHWRTCACGTVFDRGLHTYDDNSDTTCNTCGYVRTVAPTTYTVTFYANGGTETMDPVSGVSGAYTLPGCGFTAPANKEFKAWSIGGVEYNPGDSITVSGNITVIAIWKDKQITPPTPTTYTIRFDANGGSVSPASMTTGTDGKLTGLPTPTRSSYTFDGWYTNKTGGTKVTTDTVFKNDTTVYAHWTYTGGSGGDSGYTYYTLTFETNGGSTISGERFRSGTTVDLTKYTPTYKGHTFTGWYSDKGLTDKITSIKLDGNKTVYAGWRLEQNPQTGANPFTDVSKSDWFYDDVMFVYEKSLMVGTSDTTFSPYGTATRAMMATILWRMEGSPAPKNTPDFTDVASGKWYSDAIAWTTENGIYQGYGNGAFKPDDPITREQLAAIFYRYADYKGYDMTAKGSLDKLKDKDMVSTWAQDAMQWAVGSDLMKGKSNNTLDPQGTATRAEIAAMLHRFIEK